MKDKKPLLNWKILKDLQRSKYLFSPLYVCSSALEVIDLCSCRCEYFDFFFMDIYIFCAPCMWLVRSTSCSKAHSVVTVLLHVKLSEVVREFAFIVCHFQSWRNDLDFKAGAVWNEPSICSIRIIIWLSVFFSPCINLSASAYEVYWVLCLSLLYLGHMPEINTLCSFEHTLNYRKL